MNATRKRILLICLGGYVLAALLILYGYANGALSVRALGIDYTALFAVAVIVAYIVLARRHKQIPVAERLVEQLDSREEAAVRRTIRNYKVAIVIMCVVLIYGICDSKGYPLWVTLVGVAINVSITFVLMRIVRTKSAELVEFENASSK
jgi:uncharacterized protein YacL